MGEEPGRRRAPGCRAASRAEAEEIRLEDPGLGPVMLVASGRWRAQVRGRKAGSNWSEQRLGGEGRTQATVTEQRYESCPAGRRLPTKSQSSDLSSSYCPRDFSHKRVSKPCRSNSSRVFRLYL